MFREIYSPKKMDDFIIKPLKHKIIKILLKHKFSLVIQSCNSCGINTFSKLVLKEYYGINNFLMNENICIINSLKEYGIYFYRNELKTFCSLKCTIPNKRRTIYIQDLDCLNKQCQHVLRHFIDSYDINIIISTNSTNKLIECLNSRMTIIELDILTYDNLFYLSKNLVEKERLELNDKQIDLIIKYSNLKLSNIYSLFDRIKLLQGRNFNSVIENNLSSINLTLFECYLEKCKNNDIESIYLILDIYNKGYSLIDIFDDFFMFIKLFDIDEDYKYKIIQLNTKYIYIIHEKMDCELQLVFFTNDLIKIVSK